MPRSHRCASSAGPVFGSEERSLRRVGLAHEVGVDCGGRGTRRPRGVLSGPLVFRGSSRSLVGALVTGNTEPGAGGWLCFRLRCGTR